ncbi:MAG: YncE family protein [Planctomycetes bacterium]|nr:YncE family protein [Planctomycetota bacterium]
MSKLSGLRLAFLAVSVVTIAACGSGGGGANSGPMDLVVVSNGFPGQLLPYQIHTLTAPAAGFPTSTVIEIRRIEDLILNVHRTDPDRNPILPVPAWPEAATLPNGNPGNHFVLVQFTRPIKTDSVIDAGPGGAVNFGLTGSITVTALDPQTGVSTPIPGRAFIDGFTPDPAVPGQLVRWVGRAASGQPIALQPEGLGFPGVLSTFPDAARLVQPQTFVFVPDLDDDLNTFETFPTFNPPRLVRVRCSTGVKANGGDTLIAEAHASSTVGPDTLLPEVLRNPSTTAPAVFVEVGGQLLPAPQEDVNPLTAIEIEFTEPVQPGRIGQLPSGIPPTLSPSTEVSFGTGTTPVLVTFTAVPVSPYNLSRYRLQPTMNFPGLDPVTGPAPFNTVNVTVNANSVADLRYNFQVNPPAPINLNSSNAFTSFQTGEGPGIVNAPVAPGAIYVGRNGPEPGLSVIDLNGFGQSTGNPVPDDPTTPQQIEWFWNQIDPTVPAGIPTTKFVFNKNLEWGAALVPPLLVGTSTLNGGSGGLFSLTRDSALSDRVARPPILQSVADMGMGHSLDRVINNSDTTCPPQGGGGNVCAADNLRTPNTNFFQNTIQVEPEPNPPGLRIPDEQPLCMSPLILGNEVTAILAAQPPVVTQNLMAEGLPFGNPNPFFGLPTPPTGYYHGVNNGAPNFLGPFPAGTNISDCGGATWFLRQQVGHFLYVVDSLQDKVVVLNSNRMTLLDTISLPDPTRLSVEPNMKHLAVSNFSTDTVSLVDIDPASLSFHQVVRTIVVGNGPLGIAWQPDNEDLWVCNNLGNSVSVISGINQTVRKTLTNQVVSPIDCALTTRQVGIGFATSVYFGYILNQVGTVALFESGPDGANGIGFDEIIGLITETFPQPTAIQPDVADLFSGVWIAHRTALGEPAVSHLHLDNSIPGPLPLNPTNTFGGQVSPSFRNREWTVDRVVQPDQLSGIPTDLAFDNAINIGGAGMVDFGFVSIGSVISQDSKQLVRPVPGGVTSAYFPEYLFVASISSGTVDVIDIANALRVDVNPVAQGVQPILAPGASVLCDYWRQ